MSDHTRLPARRRAARPRRCRLVLEQLEDRLVPTLLGQQLFPLDNPWNQQITAAPVSARSAAVMNNIISNYGNGRLHPDFGQDYGDSSDLYGIPYNVVHGNSNSVQKVSVVIDGYPDESDVQDVPMPADPVIEGDFQNGHNDGVDNRGDSHLLIYDVDNNVGYEFYRASRPSENAQTDGMWHADQETVWDYNTNTFRTLGWTSADAAGLSILAGLVRPDEGLPVSQGGQGVINHAIRFTLRNAVVLNQYLYPASHTANPGNTDVTQMPPMGARFRLKASVDISGLNAQSKIIAQAMKDYGLILADNGSNFFFSGASYAVDGSNQIVKTWDDDDIQDSTHGLKSLTFSDFEVVDLTPRVTGLDVSRGPVGQQVTITGQNFSGAAGHLTVLFGNTPATSVTVVDDGHVTATAPNGVSTVHVRVQSGVDVGGDGSNYTSPIFGYGISAATRADLFTYTDGSGNSTDQPPTVATPASATPGRVTGKTTTLRVLGADDSGESNLTYTWALLSGPAAVTFGDNGTNTAKTATATFRRAGTYSFRVTITDLSGQSVTSTVTVTVAQTLTRISVSPSSTTVRRGGLVRFRATALDQFGFGLAAQPPFGWAIFRGVGTITQSGVYRAPNRAGAATVQARAGVFRGYAGVRVV